MSGEHTGLRARQSFYPRPGHSASPCEGHRHHPTSQRPRITHQTFETAEATWGLKRAVFPSLCVSEADFVREVSTQNTNTTFMQNANFH